MVWVFHGFSYMFTSLYEQCSKCFMQMPFDWGTHPQIQTARTRVFFKKVAKLKNHRDRTQDPKPLMIIMSFIDGWLLTGLSKYFPLHLFWNSPCTCTFQCKWFACNQFQKIWMQHDATAAQNVCLWVVCVCVNLIHLTFHHINQFKSHQAQRLEHVYIRMYIICIFICSLPPLDKPSHFEEL